MSAPSIGNEKPPELTLEQILAKANRRLPYELQVRPDDPIMGIMAINEELLNAYLSAVRQAIREAQLEITTHSQQMAKATEEQTTKLLDKLGNEVETRFQKAGNAWEEQFKALSEAELAKTRSASLYAQIGGLLVLIAGALAVGIVIGNFLFH